MVDINTQIEAKKAELTTLKQQLDAARKSKRDQTLDRAVSGGVGLAHVRAPPATKARRILKGHFGKVTALHWGGDSQTLVSASQDGNLLLWNGITSNKLQSITLKSSYVMSVGIEQSKGNLVACGGLDNLCTVYNRSNPQNAMEMASHDGFLSCCRFLNEQEIITSSGDSTCIHWNISAAKPIATFAEHTADAMFLSLKPGDPNVFVSCSVDQTAKLWDIRASTHSVQTFSGFHTSDINSVEFMPSDGNVFATCSEDNTVRLFDLRACNELRVFSINLDGGMNGANGTNNAGATNEAVPGSETTEGMTSLAFSASGRLVFCGHSDGNILAFDVLSDRVGPLFAIPAAHERHVSCVGVSPNGHALCSGGWDSLLKIWA